jgi:hypothetical protein
MSSLIPSGSATGTGAVTLIPTSSNNNQTVTLPDATGTVMVSGNMPAFSYYGSSGTSISGGTFTKITFDTKEYDTNNNFSSSRFTPTVAGYYQISAFLSLSGNTTAGYGSLSIYKNGSQYRQGSSYSSTVNSPSAAISGQVYCNGSTDYIEIYAICTNSITSGSGITSCAFSGCMMRAA